MVEVNLSDVTVVDKFIDSNQLQSLSSIFSRNIWAFGWHSTTMNDSKFYWHTHFAGGTVNSRDSCEDELSSKIELEAINEIWLSLRDIYFSEYTLLRVYANAHSFGLDGSIHRDNSP